MNRFLEERVAKRTMELKESNRLLQEKIEEGNAIQAELRASRQRFQNIFETVSAGMLIVDGASHRIVDINPAAAQWIGQSTDLLRGKNLAHLIQPANGQEGPTVALPTPHALEGLLSTSQGESIPILMAAKGSEFDGRLHWIVSFNNIQKIKEAEAIQRELEARATRAQHLQAIGTMAGGIAHDFNNILFGMLGYTELALEDAQEGSLLARNLQEVLRGGYRAKEIIHQILTFSRQENVEKKPMALTPLINEALQLLRATLPATIDIDTHFAADVHPVEVNPTRIHQVVMNLCTNAAGAIGDRPGRIRITLDNRRCAPDKQEPHSGLGAGLCVRLAVEDDGAGIPADVIPRIFEPFFTTKAQGQGTGMGLAVVLGIVQDHQGVIGVQSEAGKGTCFEILLPASFAGDGQAQTAAPPMVRGSEHILCVDDEGSLTIMMSRILSRLGYHVTVCNHPAEALTLFQDQSRAYDLVITDLTMPQMTGISLAGHLLKIRPELPIVLCTGYGEQMTPDQCRAAGFRAVLCKPVSNQELAAAVRQALIAN